MWPLYNKLFASFTSDFFLSISMKYCSTTGATKAVLSHVNDRTWWKKTIKAVLQPEQTGSKTAVDDGNEEFTRLGCHPFYRGLFDSAYESKVGHPLLKH